MINHIHHINFLVKNLEEAVGRYRDMLKLGDPIYDDLTGRAVRTARFRVGETWLILVQPLDGSSIPALHLKTHGEGFFLMSLATDNLQQTLSEIAVNGGQIRPDEVRSGIDDWQVADLDPQQFFGAHLQITEENS